MRTPSSIPVWVINLPQSIERRNNISRCMQAINIPYEFIDAVDGRALTAEERSSIYDEKKAIEHIGRPMSPGEIGCSASHLKVCRKLLASDDSAALIMEDDCNPGPDLARFLAAADNFPSDWDIIHLHWWEARTSLLKRRTIAPGIRLVRFVSPGWSSGAYLLSRNAASRMLDAADRIYVPSDHYHHQIEPIGLTVYGTLPLCVRLNVDLSSNPQFTTLDVDRAPIQQAAYAQKKSISSTLRDWLEELLWLKRRIDPKWIRPRPFNEQK